MGDTIDINHLAVWKDIYEYKKQNNPSLNCWKVFNKIIKLFYHMRIKQKEWNEKAEDKKKDLEMQSKVSKEDYEDYKKTKI